jgi:hypothetical protein
MIFGEENEPITLRVYNHATGKEYIANERFSFRTDAILGTPDETYPVTVNSSTDSEYLNGNIVLYPNPVEKRLYINHQRSLLDNLSVVDISGRVHLTVKDFSDDFIDVSSLMPGIYILKIVDKEQTYVFKFIKK